MQNSEVMTLVPSYGLEIVYFVPITVAAEWVRMPLRVWLYALIFCSCVVPVDVCLRCLVQVQALRRWAPSYKESYQISVNSIPKYEKQGSRKNMTSLVVEGEDNMFLTFFLISGN
jgi:hypothetical protein